MRIQFWNMITEFESLKAHNTFGVSAQARYFATFQTIDELRELLEHRTVRVNKRLLLGGGSNMLFTRNFDGIVLKNELKGIEKISEDEHHYYIKSAAGEVWHELVMHCIAGNYAGIENLALIPGCVGASPMQNIGAYGVEIKDVFEELEAYHIESGELHTFNKAKCEFGYRESVFKRKLKGQYVITSVTFRLSREHKLNATYCAINDQLKNMGVTTPCIHDISNAVIAIRSSKLPDPKQIGNAGSFFKNPVVNQSTLDSIKINYPDVPSYPAETGQVKLAAGWLIEKAGWKGFTENKYGVHKLQALVLVNYGGASGKEIYDLSTRILEDVFEKFGVQLEREVNIL